MKKLITLSLFLLAFLHYATANTFATADTLTVLAPDTGLLKVASQTDFYVFRMNQCGVLILNLTNIQGLNLEMTAYSDTSVDSIIGYSSYGGNRILELLAPAGNIYIKVDDHFGATNAGIYTLAAAIDSVDVYECNNSFAAAYSLPDSASVTAQIRGSNLLWNPTIDVDFYKVHISRCGTLVLNLINIPGLNLEMSAYSAPNTDSLIGYSSYGGNRTLELSVSPGDIYIKVDDHFNATSSGNYSLNITIDNFDIYECNNSFADAGPIPDDITLQAEIRGTNLLRTPQVDVDFYKLHIDRCGTLVLNLTNISGLNLEMTAYSAPNADSAIGYSSYGGNRELELSWTAGDIYIKVDDHFNATSPNPYMLAVYFDTSDIYECNNSFAEAYPVPDSINIHAKIQGTFNGVVDVDYYKVHVSRCATLVLNLTDVSGLNLEMTAYSDTSIDSIIGYSSYGGNRTLELSVSEGDIYIKVDDHFSNTSDSFYTLAIRIDTFDIYECNNSFADASPIPDDITLQAEIRGSNLLRTPQIDVDFYKLHIDRCGTLVLNLTNIPGLNLEMTAYSAPNADSTIGYSSYGGNRELELSWTAGDIYIKVDDHFNATSPNPYMLAVYFDTSDIYECNNSFAEAYPVPDSINIHAKIQGTFNGVVDVDYYKVHVSRCATLVLNLTDVPGLNLEMTAYSDTSVDSVIGYSSYGGNRTLELAVSEGDIYIKVDDHFSNTSDSFYTLAIRIDTFDIYECNNSFADASVIPDNIDLQAEIRGSNLLNNPIIDVDFYKVTVDRCGVLVLDLTDIPGLNLEMTAYNAPNTGSSIGYSGYGGNRVLELSVSAGDIYIQVDDHFNATSPTPYALSVSFDTADACECNNDFGDACTISDSTILLAQIRGTNSQNNPVVDVDYYRFTTALCGQVVINLTDIPGLNLEMTVFAASDTTTSIAYSGYGGNRSITLNLVPGEYFIKVDDHFSNTSPNDYTLALNFTPIPAIPVITPAGPVAFCIGQKAVLTTSATANQFWSTGDTSRSIIVTTTGVYTDTVRIINGCTAVSNPVIVQADSLPPVPVITPPGPVTFCNGQDTVLISSIGTNNFWNTGQNTRTITVNATGTIIDTVKSNPNCFSVSNSVEVIVNPTPPVPAITPPGPDSICPSQIAMLQSSAASGNHWSTGDTASFITTGLAGAYSDTVINQYGCFAFSASVQVVVTPGATIPTVSPTGPISICPSESDTLLSSALSGNHWSTGAVTSTIIVAQPGNYADTVYNQYGCSAFSLPVQVNFNPAPVTPAIVPAGPDTICPLKNDTLHSSAPSGNHWSSGDTTSFIVASQAGAFTDTVINQYGCVAISEPVSVTTAAFPVAGFTYSNTNGNYTFTNASANATGYRWYFGDGDSSNEASPAHTYTSNNAFTVTLIASNDCGSDTATQILHVLTGITEINGPETMSINPNPCAVCQLTGTVKAADLVITDILGRVCTATFTKTTAGYLIELPASGSGVYLVRDLKTQEVVKFVKQ